MTEYEREVGQGARHRRVEIRSRKHKEAMQAFGPTLDADADVNVLYDRFQQLVSLSQVLRSDDYPRETARMEGLLKAVAEIAPRDEMERMLAVQLVACNEAMLEALRRAALPERSPALRDVDLKHAEKLSSTSIRLVEAFDKHRGKGQQRVTVEHVHVNMGGQSIVENASKDVSTDIEVRRRAPPTIEHVGELPVDLARGGKHKTPTKSAKNGKQV